MRDALEIAGIASLTLGLFLVWIPIGFVALGVMLVAAANAPDRERVSDAGRT